MIRACAIFCCAMVTLDVCAGTGPILPVRTVDRLLDSFESKTASYDVRTRGKAQPKLTGRSGIAKHGNTSLLIEIPATGDKGRNSLIMTWTFEQPKDWSEFEGLSIWFQTHGEPAPSVTPWIFEASNGSYWWRGQTMLPRREGEWQLVEMPFKKWTWSWEAGKDDNEKLDLNDIKTLLIEIRAFEAQPFALGIDGIGLYRERPAYAGPTLWLRSHEKGRTPFLCEPGQDHIVEVALRRLPAGQRAEVDLVGTDYWGKQKLAKRLKFVGAEDATKQVQRVTFRAKQPNYIALVGTVIVDGRPVYRAESGVGCIRPMAPEDAKPNPNSIFGIWVGGGAQRIGAKWDRQLMRISTVSKVGDQYQIKGYPPGVQRNKWGALDQSRTCCFVTMAKWLSSRPDRADYQKWSPTSWDEYANIVRFTVAGAKRAGVRHYEVWNEPVPYAYWMGPMESVVKLHEVTYKAIKDVQPDAVVLGPCPYTFKWDFLEQFFTLGGGKWIDDVVVHTYDSQPPDVNFPSNLRKLRQMLARFGLDDRDVYITEMGYGTPKHTEREQARNLVRSFVYALSEGVRVFIWHMLWDWQGVRAPQNYIGDAGHAILRFDKSPRPAYVAYATMTRMLEGAQYIGPVKGLSTTQRGFEFARRGEQTRVLWDTGDGPTSLRRQDPAEKLRLIDIVGGETELEAVGQAGFALTLTEDPIYVVSD